jgi:hypothetical protein
MGKGSATRQLNRDAEKYGKRYDEVLSKELHKDTEANTDRKRQVSKDDLPVGMRSTTIYGGNK